MGTDIGLYPANIHYPILIFSFRYWIIPVTDWILISDWLIQYKFIRYRINPTFDVHQNNRQVPVVSEIISDWQTYSPISDGPSPISECADSLLSAQQLFLASNLPRFLGRRVREGRLLPELRRSCRILIAARTLRAAPAALRCYIDAFCHLKSRFRNHLEHGYVFSLHI